MKFSVLMSIYYKESPLFFDRAMRSIWNEQTLKPNEIVLVQDGKLTEPLYKIISTWKEKLQQVLNIIILKENQGLGKALNIGVKRCSHFIIARMDADDISTPDRFEKQIEFLKTNPEVDVVGGFVYEFFENENIILSYKEIPTSFSNLKRYSKYRCPINHPSVMFKKDVVLSVGNYLNTFNKYEDWFLWNRILSQGFKIQNIPEYLVKMRTQGMLNRRLEHKFAYSKILKFNHYFYKSGYYSLSAFIISSAAQCFIWSMPESILRFIYKYFLKKRA